MNLYDEIRKLEYGTSYIISSFRLRLFFYRNIHCSGLEKVHHSTQIYGRQNGTVFLGKRVSTCRNCCLVSVGGKLSVGDYSSFSENCMVVCHERVAIGRHCLFGPNTCIYDHDHRFGLEGIKGGYKTSPIIIEDNCWIGANVTILRGTHIGEGCVIGAGTVVKGEIPAHSLVTSNRKLNIQSIER